MTTRVSAGRSSWDYPCKRPYSKHAVSISPKQWYQISRDFNGTSPRGIVNIFLGLHPLHKRVTQEISKRALENFFEILDPHKSYFLRQEIEPWLDPSQALLDDITTDFKNDRYDTFNKIQRIYRAAIDRRRQLCGAISLNVFPEKVYRRDLKQLNWPTQNEDLLQRYPQILVWQSQVENERDIAKVLKEMHQEEEEILHNSNKMMHEVNIVNAFGKSLDPHTQLYPPSEAKRIKKMLSGEQGRIQSSYHDVENGQILLIKIPSFYQSEQWTVSADVKSSIERKNPQLRGIILDVRDCPGGITEEAIAIESLFFGRGIDKTPLWNGPLIILVNRASGSAAERLTQNLQDYGSLVIGDDHTFGKGSSQLTAELTFQSTHLGKLAITERLYHTASGNTPQITGVKSDILVPGPYSGKNYGEKSLKYPLPNVSIPSRFVETPSQVYRQHLPHLKMRSLARTTQNTAYQNFLQRNQKVEHIHDPVENDDQDHQLLEAKQIMQDLVAALRS